MYENVIRSVDEFIRYAVNEAFYLKDDYIGTEHILLAFLKINSRETESLISAGANYNSLKSCIKGYISSFLYSFSFLYQLMIDVK